MTPQTHYRMYFGKMWFDHMGNLLGENGHENKNTAVERIAKTEKELFGRWAFCVVKLMKQDNAKSREVWENHVQFPDGVTRTVSKDEKAVGKVEAERKGNWISLESVRDKIAPDDFKRLRISASTVVPYGDSQLVLKVMRFETMVDFEQWLSGTLTPVFVLDTHRAEKPEEAGLFAYLAVAPN